MIPPEVTVKIVDNEIAVSGPKGSLVLKFRPEIKVEIRESQILVNRKDKNRLSSSLHGLTRTLIANLIEGVTNGFSKTLKIVGTGYRASLEGERLILSVGFSHPVKIEPPTGIKFEVEGNDMIKITGIDKALVNQTAANLRKIRPPEPYKGKGIRYQNEEIKQKPGKAGKAGVAGAPGGGK